MMKKIQKKYSKKNIDYINLQSLPFDIIRLSGDNFYKKTDNSVITKNLSWKTEPIIIQSTLFDLKELCLLSRIHFNNSKIMKIKLEIAEAEEGPFIEIFSDLTIVSGNIRVLKIGNVPCRYFRIKILKGCNLQDYNLIECFGMKTDHMQNIYDRETMEILLYNSYDLIYRDFNK